MKKNLPYWKERPLMKMVADFFVRHEKLIRRITKAVKVLSSKSRRYRDGNG